MPPLDEQRGEAYAIPKMTDQPVALVTGANRGLGQEAARQLLERGYQVLLGSRDLEKGRAVASQLGDAAQALELDVASSEQLSALSDQLQALGRIDALVNNAGITGEAGFRTSVLESDLAELEHVLNVNLLGAIRVSAVVVPLMRQHGTGAIVNVSSGMGQLSDMGKGSAPYRISKTALNAFTRILSQELSDTQIKVNSVCPGWVRTDLGGPNAKLSVQEGARGIVWAATLGSDGPTGGFFRHGKPIDW